MVKKRLSGHFKVAGLGGAPDSQLYPIDCEDAGKFKDHPLAACTLSTPFRGGVFAQNICGRTSRNANKGHDVTVLSGVRFTFLVLFLLERLCCGSVLRIVFSPPCQDFDDGIFSCRRKKNGR